MSSEDDSTPVPPGRKADFSEWKSSAPDERYLKYMYDACDERNQPRPNIGRADRMRIHAQRFWFITWNLRSKFVEYPDDYNLIHPIVVNATFTIELILKAICLKAGVTPPRDHRLANIYNKIPSDVRSEVIEQADKHRQLHSVPQRSISDCLLSLNEAFVHWRYAFEHDDDPMIVNPNEIFFAMSVLWVACSKMIFYGSIRDAPE